MIVQILPYDNLTHYSSCAKNVIQEIETKSFSCPE